MIFQNLIGFTNKKMPNKIIFLKMFVNKVFQLVNPFLANLHSTVLVPNNAHKSTVLNDPKFL